MVIKESTKIIKDIFDFDKCVEWDMEHEEIFGQKCFMFCWNYKDFFKLTKKYPYLKQQLGLDCDLFKKIVKENDANHATGEGGKE